MVGKRNQPTPQRDAPSLPSDPQPAGSGASPGTGAPEATFGETMKAEMAGKPVEFSDRDEEPMVEYLGEFGKREISVADWEKAGVTGMPLVAWDRRTGHKVPKSVFTEQALQVLRQDGGFRVP